MSMKTKEFFYHFSQKSRILYISNSYSLHGSILGDNFTPISVSHGKGESSGNFHDYLTFYPMIHLYSQPMLAGNNHAVSLNSDSKASDSHSFIIISANI